MKNILNRLLFNVKYYLFWVLYFVFARGFFLIYYFDKTNELSFTTTIQTFAEGIQLDLSFAAYLVIIPFLLITVSIVMYPKGILKFIKAYTYILIVVISLLLLIDAGLYQAWGLRLDASLLDYLNTPTLMISSTSTFQLVSGIIGWFLISFLFIRMYKSIHQKNKDRIAFGKWLEIPVFIVVLAALIIPIRGGLQTIPVNQSNVYFSNNMFANHAAINFMWNFSNTISHKTDKGNPYKKFDEQTAKEIIQNRRKELLTVNTDTILTIKKPNVILIIWESLSAKIVGSLGGEPNVTPNLNQLSKEGILFTNFYANGDRTDEGIPAILSGYYPQPTKKIMRMPNKTRSLPMLPKEMSKLGYTTSFYYGGDFNFGNMNTYLRSAGISNFVDGNEFDSKDWSSKWGAFDDAFMKRFADDLSTKQEEPFFKIALTLSSHEPFEIRGEYVFGKDTEDNLYRSSHFYTDKVIGDFISFAKKQNWYKNTLIVIMADHGNRLPIHEGEYNSPKKFKIPMLWLGGAVNSTIKEVNTIATQVDFSYTLLDLLRGDNSKFVFGKSLFNNTQNQFAYYTYNKGFGILDDKGVFVYDYIAKKPLLKEGNTYKLDSLGKALTQNSYRDLLERK
jgi:phosphoglycerol transferase MdoB-like AlkP superfamily enzyme